MEFEQYAFNKVKRIVACDTLLTYPNFNEAFKIHTKITASRLGAFIVHKGKPIALYGRKITDTQQRYTLIER